MKLSLEWVFGTVASILGAALWVGYLELNQLRGDLDQFRYEVARDYASREEMNQGFEETMAFLLRLEQKIDRVIER